MRNSESLPSMYGGFRADGKSDEEIAGAGVEALADFIKEIGMPTTLKELGIDETVDLKEIAGPVRLFRAVTKR